jgi:hypothetical protein
MNVAENICPVCNTKNELEAVICEHCGATLDNSFINSGPKTKTTDMEALTPEMIRDWTLKEATPPQTPESGIAVYVEGQSTPAYVDSNGEFVLGRKSEATSGTVVDLAPFRGYTLGLSRRHAVIRQTADGYEVMDLGSVNGTFLNEERLIPHRSYPLPNGAHLRLAHMRLFVLYRPVVEQ